MSSDSGWRPDRRDAIRNGISMPNVMVNLAGATQGGGNEMSGTLIGPGYSTLSLTRHG
jgi:hypothetical protein